MPKGGILYLIMVFAPWEAIIKYNVLSPMGVFVLGGIYKSIALAKGIATIEATASVKVSALA